VSKLDSTLILEKIKVDSCGKDKMESTE